ncbi:MAG: hypothetical protein HYU41_26670 [Candidatus Rokubacteria bacterium]|nr:hypothetical protein [Candidatus Rokubacteria bacterium]
MQRLWDRLTDERGIALPMAMIVLVILTALTLAFTSLGKSEPLIARNHSMSAQSRAYAESGFERAIWAMNNATPAFTSGTAAAPYDGSQLLTVSAHGAFTVRVTDGSTTNEKLVLAVGWAPDNTGQLRAVRKIEATLARPPFSTQTPLCGLCVTGGLQLGGNALIDARGNHCTGTTPLSGTVSTEGTVTAGNAYSVYGPGNDVKNESGDLQATQPASNVPSLTWDELQLLKSRAKAAGTYYQGNTTFKDNCGVNDTNCHSLPASGGIVFVDTTTGNDISDSTTSSEMGNVSIAGSQTFNGWLIALGDINISGTVAITGAVYARNDFVFNGNGEIRGAVATANKLDTVSSSVDSTQGGSSRIVYDCEAYRTGGGTITSAWALSAGSFRETSGQ